MKAEPNDTDRGGVSAQATLASAKGTSSMTITDRVRLSPVSDRTLPAQSGSFFEPVLGQKLGGTDGQRFELLERLGGGGMATVFLARDTVLDRTVAIKFITREELGAGGPEAIERVRLEARACARLSHENIVRLFDLGTDEGVPYLVMEHLEGRPLDAIMQDEGVDARRAVRILIDVARGLAQAHRAGIVHRDLKPNNVFIVKDGTAKILDFGVATMTARPDGAGKELSGTPRYMSPEQWRGDAQDGRTDIWATGVMLFELLAGRSPFGQGSNLLEVRDAIISEEPAPSLRDARPDLPEEAEHVCQRAMKKNAAERFGTADELLYALVGLEVAIAQAMHASAEGARKASAVVRAKSERRQTTIISCSLCDMHALAEEIDLDDFSELAGGFAEVCSTVVRQLEGTLLSSVGGHVVACFGFPTAHEDDALRAVRAALLIVDAIRSRTGPSGRPHAARVGIHTSLSIAGRSERSAIPFTLHGDALHVARWIEERAAPSEVLIGQRTQVLARSIFELESLGDSLPDGATRTIPTYRVLRPKEGSSRFDPVAGGALTPLVGRDRELDELRDVWESVKAGRGRFALITGEAGIGKSRLVVRHLDHIASEPHFLLRCQCWAHFQNSALHPIVEGFRRAVGVRENTGAPEKLQRVEAALRLLDMPLDEYVPLFAAFAGEATNPRYPKPQISPDLLKKRMLDALVVLLTRLARRQPLVVVVEDVHWADAFTLELLDLLHVSMAEIGLAIIVTARPEFQPPWPQRAHTMRLALNRLSPSQTAAMIAFASQGRILPAEVIEQLVRRTDGIPLFIEELTAKVADAGDALAPSQLPASLEELLRVRLNALPQNGKEVAQLAAVLGRDTTYELVRRTSHLPEESLRTGLMQLVETGMLRQRGEGSEASYTFKHVLMQEAAYQSLVKTKRRHIHRLAAEALLEYCSEEVERNPELVGAHFLEAGCHEEAVTFLSKAGHRAVQRAANVDALMHYRRALTGLQMLPPGAARDRRELALRLPLGNALMAIGRYGSAEVHETYTRARELARAAGDDPQPFLSVWGIWQFSMMAGEIAESVELGKQLVAQAERSGDPAKMVFARRALAASLMLTGDLDACREQVEGGLELYDFQRDRALAKSFGHDGGVMTSVHLAWSLWGLGHVDRALEHGLEAVRMARQIDNPLDVAYALSSLANVHNRRGEYEEAHRACDEATRISEAHGFILWISMSKIERANARVARGDRDGISELEEGVALWCQTGARAGMSSYHAMLATAFLRAGDPESATRSLDEARDYIAASGERFLEAEILRLRGEVLLARGEDTAAAMECFERGLELARARQARSWEVRLATTYAALLAGLSRKSEARAVLAPVVAWFTEGLDTVDVRAARELLGTLE